MHAIWELECCDCKAISAFASSSQRAKGTGVEGRQVTGVIYCGHSLQNHVDKKWLTSSDVGSIPAKANFFSLTF